MAIRRPAVFLDRDGTLNEMVYDQSRDVTDSPHSPDEVVLRRRAAPFVQALNHLGYLCLVVTNQPGVAKGTLTLERLGRIHEKLEADLERNGALLQEIYFCPHHPDPGADGRPEYKTACSCRKPGPGLLLQAAADHRVDLGRSFIVGDGLIDTEAGRRAGVTTILLTHDRPELLEQVRERPEVRPDHLAVDLDEALAIIVQQRKELIAART
jgi:D-glycero-D-manno-heptose 1,7-bisphosphate phosphatase